LESVITFAAACNDFSHGVFSHLMSSLSSAYSVCLTVLSASIDKFNKRHHYCVIISSCLLSFANDHWWL